MAGLPLDLLSAPARPRGLAVLALLAGLALAAAAHAQLSPGPLSRVHEHLEGVRHCTDCHGAGRGDVREGCLDCHTLLAGRIRAGRGLHARPGHEVCETCHHEHLGRDFSLIVWPDGGPGGFDHLRTGFELQGAHRDLACRRCHRADLVADPARLRAAGKDLDRTFLGLPTDCAGCHGDPHRGQFERTCTACHDQRVWRPAAGFHHDQDSAFALTGRHAEVACERCHPPLADATDARTAARRYRPVPHAACTDCHRDPHAGQLGTDCVRCHATAGWRQLAATDFDHDRTAFPLRGRHVAVRCDRCHGQRPRTEPLAHARCVDCHRDVHAARASGRERWLRCEDCHDVQGYLPAHFTLAAHDTTAFPLRGAHRAVPCLACHERRATAAGPRVALAVAHAACTDCHANPHGPALARWLAPDGCRACHDEDSWRAVAFDHGRTDWPLAGRHAAVACRKCHRETAGGAADTAPAFAGAPRRCAGCHEDPHRGQFAGDDDPAPAACERCHVPAAWRPAARFDHDRDAAFALTGAHERVACERCHPQETDAAGPFVRYRPLPGRCVDCHGPTPPAPQEEKP